MVLHPEAGRGGLPTRVQKTKIYLETDEFASTPPFLKKYLAGVISGVTFGRELFKNYLAGTFQKTFSGNF
jgi:hypothetical protein